MVGPENLQEELTGLEDARRQLRAAVTRWRAHCDDGFEEIVAPALLAVQSAAWRVNAAAEAVAVGPVVEVSDVVAAVAAIWRVRAEDVMGRDKRPRFVQPRHAAMYLARRLLGMSYPELARAFRRDHSTVQNGVKRTVAALAEDDRLAARIDAAERVIEGPDAAMALSGVGE